MSRAHRLNAPEIARSAPPVVLLLGALAVPELATVGTVILIGGTIVALGRRAPVAWAWAATVPAGALAAVREVSGVRVLAATTCDAFGAPGVGWGIAQAVLVVAVVTTLTIALRTGPSSVGIRWPAGGTVRLAIAGLVVLATAGFVAVSIIGGGLPMPRGPEPSGLAFVMAVVAGGAAIGIAEELAFRGALQHWLARTIGEWPGAVLGAVAYGIWVGAIGWGPVFAVVAGAAGLVAGALAIRTRSLLVPVAWHIGVAIPLLAWLICSA